MQPTRFSRLADQLDTSIAKYFSYMLIASIIAVSLLARKPLLSFVSGDYTYYFGVWYMFAKTHGGFWALRYNFADYNVPYLYFIVAITFLPIKPLLAIKGFSLLFDFFLAFIVYLLTIEKYPNKYIGIIAALGVLFLPTIFLNSSMWGQTDSIYSSFCLLSLYFIVKKKGQWSCIAAGLAFAIKLQAIFFLPVLLIAVLKKEIRVIYLFLLPLTYFVSLLPALVAGRSLASLLSIYVNQAKEFNYTLSLNAPNFYIWIPGKFATLLRPAGTYFTLGLVLLFCLILLQFKDKLTKELTIQMSLLFTLLIPFFLPQMHDRYFYLAEVSSVLYAIYFPRRFYILFLVQIPGICVYAAFLMGVTVIPFEILPFFLIGALGVVIYDLLQGLRLQPEQTPSEPLHLPEGTAGEPALLPGLPREVKVQDEDTQPYPVPPTMVKI